MKKIYPIFIFTLLILFIFPSSGLSQGGIKVKVKETDGERLVKEISKDGRFIAYNNKTVLDFSPCSRQVFQ